MIYEVKKLLRAFWHPFTPAIILRIFFIHSIEMAIILAMEEAIKKESIPREAFIRDAIGDCPLCLEPVIDRPIQQVNSFYHI